MVEDHRDAGGSPDGDAGPLEPVPRASNHEASTSAGDVLFLGGVFPRDEEATIVARSKGPIQNAANALQWAIIGGLDANLGRPVSLLNAVFVGSFPRLYRDVWVKSRRWSHASGASDRSVGFLNLFGVKHLWRIAAVALALGRWAFSRRGALGRSIIVYSLHSPFLIAAALAKRIDPSIKVCILVPDLPEYMNTSEERDRVRSALKAIDSSIVAGLVRSMDCFVLLTRYMAEPLRVADRPWIVMEGAVDLEGAPARVPQRSRNGGTEKVILYTGTLQRAYGICELLEAFSLLPDPDCRLWICGAGEAESDVLKMAARDDRVRFWGQVGRSEALALQRQATVLVNPRGDSAEFTKYSFPSKVLEYMASGTPAIVRRLPGMPEEYCDYLFVVDGRSPSDLAKKMSEVCNMSVDARVKFAERAQRFVFEQKNGRVQARRVLQLIDTARREASR